MTTTTAAQLLHLVDRAERGSLLAEEAQQLRDGIRALEKLHEAHVRVEQRLAREGLAAGAAVERLTDYADRMERHGHLVSAVSVAQAVRRHIAGPAQRPVAPTGAGAAAPSPSDGLAPSRAHSGP